MKGNLTHMLGSLESYSLRICTQQPQVDVSTYWAYEDGGRGRKQTVQISQVQTIFHEEMNFDVCSNTYFVNRCVTRRSPEIFSRLKQYEALGPVH